MLRFMATDRVLLREVVKTQQGNFTLFSHLTCLDVFPSGQSIVSEAAHLFRAEFEACA